MPENIDIVATFTDMVSRPADKAARAIDNVGDEARETAAEMQALDAATAKSGASWGEYAADLDEVAASMRKHNALKKESIDLEKQARSDEKAAAAMRREAQTIFRETERLKRIAEKEAKTRAIAEKQRVREEEQQFQTRMNRLRRLASLPKNLAASIGGFVMPFMKIGGILSLLPLAATGIQGLAAAALAGVAALGPLTGIVGLLGGLLPAVASGMAIFKTGFSGFGEAFGLLNNPDADAGAVDKAMNNVSTNARQLLANIILLKREWKGFKFEVQDALFNGLGPQVKNLSRVMQPTVRRNVRNGAAGVNREITDFLSWLSTPEGVQLVDKALLLGNVVIENMASSVGRGMMIALRLAELAGPLVMRVSGGVDNMLTRFDKYLTENGPKVTAFFNDAADAWISWGSAIKDFGGGLGGIFRAANPLVDDMGEGISKAFENFNKWSNSTEGQETLQKWFKDMIPVVDELTGLVGDLLEAIWGLGDGDGQSQFLAFVKVLREDVVPAISKFFENIKETDIVESFTRIIQALATVITSPGFAEALAGVASSVADVVVKLAAAFNSLDPDQQEALIKTIMAVVLLSNISGAMGGGDNGGILGMLLGGKGGGGAMAMLSNPKSWQGLLYVLAAVAGFYLGYKVLGPWFEDLWSSIMNFNLADWAGSVADGFHKVSSQVLNLIEKINPFGEEFMRPFYIIQDKMEQWIRDTGKVLESGYEKTLKPVLEKLSGGVKVGATKLMTKLGLNIQKPAMMSDESNWDKLAARADGGLAAAGLPTLVGERGFEGAVDYFGNISLVGLNGPEIIQPVRDQQIVPHEFMLSLDSRDGRNSSSSAQSEIRDSIYATAKIKGESNYSSESTQNNYDFAGAVFQSPLDIQDAIEAIEKHNKNKKERGK